MIHPNRWRRAVGAAALAVACLGAWAHGDEPHGDAPHPVAAPAAAVPRFESSTDLFEVVGRLQDGAFTLYVNRFETNEPVLQAAVEVESGGLKAIAPFDAAREAYRVGAGDLLQALSKPGEHALLITVAAGSEADLLEGPLVVAAPAPPPARWAAGSWALPAAAGGTLLLGAGAALWRAWRRRGAGLASASASAVLLAGLLAGAPADPARAGPGAHGPDGEHLDAPSVALPDSLARLPDGSVHVPVPAQRRMGLRTVVAPMASAAATLELPGRVVMDPNASGRVQTVAGGRLLPGPRGLPVPGQAVRQGEVLARVAFNPPPLELASQRAQVAEVRSALPVARARVARLETLEGTVPRKDLEAARAEVVSLEAREAALAGAVSTTEALVAPVSGVIARADAVAGQVVEPRDVLFEVIDPARLLVEATTADPAVVGRIAGATLAGLPDVTLQWIGAARTLRDGALPMVFRARVRGPVPLAVGQPVTVVATLAEPVRGVVLPAQAVTRSPANEPVVWIKGGAERYVPQPVQVRPLDARRVVVVQGLAADQRVVVEGASLIAQIR